MNGLSDEHRALVARQIAALRAHGWPAHRALGLVVESLPQSAPREALAAVARELEAGREPEPGDDPLLVLLARGDAAGPEALREAARAFGDEIDAARVLRTATFYPSLFAAGGLALLALLGWVVTGPFGEIYSGGALPAPTQFMVDVLSLARWAGLPLAIAALLFGRLFPRRWALGFRELRLAGRLRLHAARLLAGAPAELPFAELAADGLRLTRVERTVADRLFATEEASQAARAMAGAFEVNGVLGKRWGHVVLESALGLGFGVVFGFIAIGLFLPFFSLAGVIH